MEPVTQFSQTFRKDRFGFEKNYTLSEAVELFIKPCGRFKSPLSWKDKLEIFIAKFVSRSRIFNTIVALPVYDISPNWQILLNYLAKEGVIVRPTFHPFLQHNDYPPSHTVYLVSHLDQKVTDGKLERDQITAFGNGPRFEDAYGKAVGEMLERYTLALFRIKDLLFCSRVELVQKGELVLDISAKPQFLPWQKEHFKELGATDRTTLSWVEGRELISNRRAYVPAQLIFWSRTVLGAKSDMVVLQQPTSNGQAGGFTFEESVLSAIYENVERDAFLIYWLNTLSPKRIALDSIQNPDVVSVIASAQRYGLDLYFLDTTSDIEIPACICVVMDRRGPEPRLAMGGGAGFDIQKNLLSSANEAISVAQNNYAFDVPKNYKPFLDTTITKKERMGLWRGSTMIEHFNFFIGGEEVPLEESRFANLARTFPSKKEEYSFTRELFKHLGEGYELYCYQAKHAVLSKLGYVVTKVVIPKLVPLYLAEYMATLDAERLYEVPKKLGFENTKLNPWPHPFP